MAIEKELKPKRIVWEKKDGKPTKVEVSYNEPDHQKLYAYGSPISLELAKEIIQNYRKEKEEKSPVAFTFGKGSLLSLLMQENCEGIRFYLAKKEFGSSQPGWGDGLTLVAVGVKADQDGDLSKDQEIGVGSDHILDETKDGGDGMDVLIFETVPPFGFP